MTANSDYGVSIVESFAPPMNWQPGQEVNKDVYAVNTGNIEAFVKEELSGILEYSFEYTVNNFDATCVTLDQNDVVAIDGATTNEAGGFLAWTNATIDDGNGNQVAYPTGYVNVEFEKGYINSARLEDNIANTWRPTVAGDYIFRRSIGTKHVEADPDHGVVEHDETVYKYAGYHFEPNGEGITDDKYYKIVIGEDPFRAAETITDDDKDDPDGSTRFVFDISVDGDKLGNGAVPGDNGLITGNPKIQYVQVEHIAPTDVSFRYNDATGEGEDRYNGAPYLEVRFKNGTGDMSAKSKAVAAAEKALADAQKDLIAAEEAAGPQSHNVAEKEVDYYNALYAYNTAKSRYDKTNADFIYAKALAQATNNLFEPAYNRYQAEQKKEELLQALKDAKDALDTEVQTEYTSTTSDSFDSFTEIKNAMLSTATGAGATGIDKDILVPESIRTAIANSANGYGGGAELTNVKDNLAALDSIWKQIAGANEDGNGGILKEIADDYDKFVNAADPAGNKETDLKPDTLDKADPKGYYQLLLEDLDRLEELLIAYADTYTNFVTAADEAHLTGLDNTAEALKSRVEAFYDETTNESVTTPSGKVQLLEERVKDMTALGDDNDVRGLKGRIDDYRTAYNNYYTYMEEKPFTVENPTWENRYYKAVDDWNTAITNYNTAVSSAKSAYDQAIAAEQDTKNAAIENKTITKDSGKWTLVNDGETLVNTYSAHNAAQRGKGVSEVSDNDGKYSTSDADPQILTDSDKDYKKYLKGSTTLAQGDNVTVPVDTSFVQLNADSASVAAQVLKGDGSENDESLNAKLGAATTAKNEAYSLYNTAKNDAKTVMDALKAAQDAVTAAETNLTRATNAEVTAESSNIDIDVVLDKDVVKSSAQNTTEKATWVFDEVTNQTTTPTFYYNRVVDPGETTNKLVDKLVLRDSVTSEDYVDLTFDLNVKLDSAQALYDNATHTTITTEAVDANEAFEMDAAVAADNQKVTWTRTAGGTGTGGEGGTGTGGETPATENVDVIVTGADPDHNLIKMVKTGTGDSATWAVADSGSTVEDAASGYHYTVNNSGEYRNVTLGLIPALNAVTGDTTPVVAYVADD